MTKRIPVFKKTALFLSNSEYMFLRDSEYYTTIRARPVDTSCFRTKIILTL